MVDLRSPAEIASRPNRLPPGAVAVEVPVTDVSMSPSSITERLAAGDTEGIGAEMLLTGNRALRPRIAGDVRACARNSRWTPSHRPIVFHCTAGKDRTGFASALVLLALGVPVDVGRRRLPRIERAPRRPPRRVPRRAGERLADLEPLRELLEVRREYLEAGLDAIADDYGSSTCTCATRSASPTPPACAFRADLLEAASA